MIHIETTTVLGVPWRYLGRNKIAFHCHDDGSRHFGPLRWTHEGARRALLKKIKMQTAIMDVAFGGIPE